MGCSIAPKVTAPNCGSKDHAGKGPLPSASTAPTAPIHTTSVQLSRAAKCGGPATDKRRTQQRHAPATADVRCSRTVEVDVGSTHSSSEPTPFGPCVASASTLAYLCASRRAAKSSDSLAAAAAGGCGHFGLLVASRALTLLADASWVCADTAGPTFSFDEESRRDSEGSAPTGMPMRAAMSSWIDAACAAAACGTSGAAECGRLGRARDRASPPSHRPPRAVLDIWWR